VRFATPGLLAQHDETRDNRMMGRFAVACAVVAALAAPASADIFRLSAELQAGGMYGKGASGDQQDTAFAAKAPHFVYGAQVTGELFFLDAWVQHQQFADFNGTFMTWTQFGLGVHFQFDQGTEQERKQKKGNFLEFAAGGFYGIGTPIQVKPPLDKAQLSDQGFSLEGRFGVGKHLSSVFDIVLTVPASYGWFTKPNDSGCSANNLSCSYQAWQIEVLAQLRGTLRL
jgi:hypothetical protein